jgi:uncharacterized protein (DUF305 family)
MSRITPSARIAGLVVAAAIVAVFVVWLTGRGAQPADQAGAPAGPTAPNIVQPGAPGASSSTLAPEDVGRLGTIPATEADVDFVEGMILHHAQALVMADYVPARTTGQQIRLLAKRLRIGQQSEIDQMEQWLADHRAEAPGATASGQGGHGHHTGHLMPGMLTAAELARMEAARGTAFDRLFLQYMIRHHVGALTMIKQLDDAGGGSQSELDNMVRHIDTDQTVEINRMRQLLDRVR